MKDLNKWIVWGSLSLSPTPQCPLPPHLCTRTYTKKDYMTIFWVIKPNNWFVRIETMQNMFPDHNKIKIDVNNKFLESPQISVIKDIDFLNCWPQKFGWHWRHVSSLHSQLNHIAIECGHISTTFWPTALSQHCPEIGIGCEQL